MVLGWPPGSPHQMLGSYAYVRDPRGIVKKRYLQGPSYRRDVRPPKDAISTGITNGYATIWTSERVGDRAIFVQIGDRFERWPRTDFGCA